MTGRAEMSGQPPLISRLSSSTALLADPVPPLLLRASCVCQSAVIITVTHRAADKPPWSGLFTDTLRRLSVCWCWLLDPQKNPAAAALLVHSAGVLSVMHCTNLISHIKKKKKNIWLWAVISFSLRLTWLNCVKVVITVLLEGNQWVGHSR